MYRGNCNVSLILFHDIINLNIELQLDTKTRVKMRLFIGGFLFVSGCESVEAIRGKPW